MQIIISQDFILVLTFKNKRDPPAINPQIKDYNFFSKIYCLQAFSENFSAELSYFVSQSESASGASGW